MSVVSHVETIVCRIYLKIDSKYFHKNWGDENWTLDALYIIISGSYWIFSNFSRLLNIFTEIEINILGRKVTTLQRIEDNSTHETDYTIYIVKNIVTMTHINFILNNISPPLFQITKITHTQLVSGPTRIHKHVKKQYVSLGRKSLT